MRGPPLIKLGATRIGARRRLPWSFQNSLTKDRPVSRKADRCPLFTTLAIITREERILKNLWGEDYVKNTPRRPSGSASKRQKKQKASKQEKTPKTQLD